MRKAILLVYFLLISFLSSSQTIVWDGKNKFMNIGQQVSFLEDPAGKLAIEQVSSPAFSGRFTKSKKIILNFGFTESVYWIKFSVHPSYTEPLLLEVAQARLPSVSLFSKNLTGRWKSYEAGYTIPLEDKPIKHHFQLFPLYQNNTDYFLRIRYSGAPIPLTIWKESVYEQKKLIQLITYGIYLGIMTFVILNNLFLFISLRRFTYLYYTFLVLLYASFSALNDGYILYLNPTINLTPLYILNPIIAQPTGLLYSIFFLNIRKYAPGFYRFALLMAVYFTSYIIWYRFLPTMTVFQISQIHALLGIFLMTFLGIKVGVNGNKLGYYFATAYCILFVFALIEIVYIATGSPSYSSEISYISTGLIIEVFILSYALSKRFEWEQKDTEKSKTEAQQLLLEKTQENEQLLLSQNETLEREVAERTNAIVQKSSELQQSLDTLKATQNQLIQKEKMASLGELTAGIAHEIQNPLNFVNNFAEVSAELAQELEESLQAGDAASVASLSADLRQNMHHIARNGQRASAIVRSMLEHSRSGTDERQPTDLNALAEEYLKLAYHGMRAKDSTFNVQLVTDLDPELGKIELSTQEIGRVLLNLYNNAFYAVRQKQAQQSNGYKPTVSVRTHRQANTVELRVKDNGTGIPESVKQKIFQPFFTTKPAGEGTGLGLSLSYDIVTKGYGGEMTVVSQEGEGTAFVVQLPLHALNKSANLNK